MKRPNSDILSAGQGITFQLFSARVSHQKSVRDEKHWQDGKLHGIDREWNFAGKLRRGFPKYWVHDQAVGKRQYLAAARKDPTLPPFRLKDNRPRREFPPEIRQLLDNSIQN